MPSTARRRPRSATSVSKSTTARSAPSVGPRRPASSRRRPPAVTTATARRSGIPCTCASSGSARRRPRSGRAIPASGRDGGVRTEPTARDPTTTTTARHAASRVRHAHDTTSAPPRWSVGEERDAARPKRRASSARASVSARSTPRTAYQTTRARGVVAPTREARSASTRGETAPRVTRAFERTARTEAPAARSSSPVRLATQRGLALMAIAASSRSASPSSGPPSRAARARAAPPPITAARACARRARCSARTAIHRGGASSGCASRAGVRCAGWARRARHGTTPTRSGCARPSASPARGRANRGGSRGKRARPAAAHRGCAARARGASPVGDRVFSYAEDSRLDPRSGQPRAAATSMQVYPSSVHCASSSQPQAPL